MQIHSALPDPAKSAGDELGELIQEVPNNQSILLLLSGGSSFSILEHLNREVLDDRITISVLDERYSIDPQVNNFAQLRQMQFYEVALERECSFIDTQMQNHEECSTLRDRFEDALLDWRTWFPEGKIFCSQGIGTDGHTAGILPFPEDEQFFTNTFDTTEKWVVAYQVDTIKTTHTERITVSYPFLREQIDTSIVYVTGNRKKGILERALADVGSYAVTPARIIRDMKDIRFYSDIAV